MIKSHKREKKVTRPKSILDGKTNEELLDELSRQAGIVRSPAEPATFLHSETREELDARLESLKDYEF